jgi:hypothetical protein
MATKPILKHKEVSQRAIDFVNSKKIIDREPFYKALERLLGIEEKK